MTLAAKTAESRATLAQSATFAMSLGAKELFHTNFLAFLLESADTELADLQMAVRAALGLPVLPGESTACAVWRERHNLDLVIAPLLEEDEEGEQEGMTPNLRRCLVVEAKLKSVPTHAQLHGYLTKWLSLPYPTPDSKEKRLRVDAEIVRRVLLTPTAARVHDQWQAVGWEAICKALRGSLASLSGGSKLRSILADYAEALEHVLHIVRVTRERVREVLANGCYWRLHEELMHQEIRLLRLHDLTGKVAFDEWVTSLHTELAGRLQQEEQRGKNVRGCVPYVHFSRSQPGLDLETTYGAYNLGIQVQGMQLRRYVSSKHPRANLEDEVLSDHKLMNAWLTGACCGRNLTGVGEQLPARQCRQRRAGKGEEAALSTLRAFNAKRFLYTAVDLRGLPMAQVHQEAIDSMVVACSLS